MPYEIESNYRKLYLTDNLASKIFEPPHDKTNKMTVRPAKT